MIYTDFNGEKISKLGMGAMRLPIKEGGKDRDIDYEKAQAIIDMAMANGVNYFDTAHVYHGGGASEKFLGDALKKYPRESWNVATKYNIGAEKDYKKCFAEQLERLQTDHIDFYLIHCILDNNIQEYLDSGCIEFFEQMKAEGKIRYLGFSSHASVQTLERFCQVRKWDFAQIQFNYYDWLYGNTQKEYEILCKYNFPVVSMESIRGGRLSDLGAEPNKVLNDCHPDWSVSSWALRWILSKANFLTHLSGMSTVPQMEDNLKTYSAESNALNADEEKTLFKACDLFRTQLQVPCTACRYCCEDCPVQINIPEVLRVYNTYKLQGAWALNKLKEIKSEGMPKDCVGCGACTGHCPQNIDVPAIMEELKQAGW